MQGATPGSPRGLPSWASEPGPHRQKHLREPFQFLPSVALASGHRRVIIIPSKRTPDLCSLDPTVLSPEGGLRTKQSKPVGFTHKPEPRTKPRE